MNNWLERADARTNSAARATGNLLVDSFHWPDWFFVPGSLTHFTA